MHVARRFGKFANLANLNNSKFEALEDLTEAEVRDLNAGKDVLGLNLDDIDRMTARQLREELRQGRKQAEKLKNKHKKEVSEMSDELSTLRLRVAGQEPPTKEQIAGAKLDECLKPFNAQLQDAIFAMNRCIDMIAEVQRIEAIGYVQLNGWVLKQSADIANITETFTELQDALNDIHIDRADADTDGA